MRPKFEFKLRWSQDLSKTYWKEVNKFVKGTAGSTNYMFWVSLVTSASLTLLAIKLSENTPMKSSPIVWLFIGYISQYLISYSHTQLLRRKYIRFLLSRPLTLGRFSEEGISTNSDWGKYEYSWKNVQDISVSDKGFVLLLSGANMIPVLNSDLPDGLTQHEALQAINTWRSV